MEKGQFSSGASIHNAGFACFGSAGELLADLVEMEMNPFLGMLEQRIEGLIFLKERVPFKAMDYKDSGGMEMFIDQKAFLEVEEKLDELNKIIMPLTGDKETYHTSAHFGKKSVFCKHEGMMDSGKLIHFLSEQVSARGAKFMFGRGVEEVNEGKVKLKGMEDPILASRILLATNGFSQEIIPDLPVRPARNYVMITRPLAHINVEGPVHHHQGFVYFRPVGQRLLLGGGRHVSIDTEFTSSTEIPILIKEWLLTFAEQHLNINVRDNLEIEWTGTLGISADKLPHWLTIQPNLDWIGGYSGMGVGASVSITRKWAKGL